MLRLLAGCLWGLFLLLSFTGWGLLVHRLLVPASRFDWASHAASGVAALVALGGLLNLLHAVSPAALWLLLGLGAVLGALELARRSRSARPFQNLRGAPFAAQAVFLVGFVLAAVLYVSSSSTSQFNPHDDLQGYFVFPTRLLQTGSLGDDPFSQRRLATGLGGKSFLDTLVLLALPYEALHLLDRGVGLLVWLGLLLAFCRQRASWTGSLLALGLILLTPSAMVNTTAAVWGAVLFTALFLLLDHHQALRAGRPYGYAVLAGLLSAALCSLKYNLIPAGVILLAGCIALSARRSPSPAAVLARGAVAALVLVAILLPWMLSLRSSSGTFLFPLLGKGFHGTAYDSGYLAPSADLASPRRLFSDTLQFFAAPPILSLILLGAALLRFRRAPASAPLASLLLASLAAALLVHYSVGGFHTWRYVFPFVHAAIVLSVAELWRDPSGENPPGHQRLPVAALVSIACGAFLVGDGWSQTRAVYKNALLDIRRALGDAPAAFSAQPRQYAAALEAVPPGQTILARLDRPYLLDFRRHAIYVADYPGGASPPPGMPFFQGPERLAEYLLEQQVRFVAYSYRSEASFGESEKPRLTSYYPIVRTEAAHTFDFQSNLARLGSSRKRIYDDGEVFVLDLSQPALT